MSAWRVLVVGGTGAFGRRLVEGLVATTAAAVIVAGRDLAACETLAAEMRGRHPGRNVEAARLDRSTASVADIAALDPAIVVDAAGPFQGADLRFAREVIAARRHYIDIADARDFVAAFPSLNGEARAAGVVAIAGASSTPALSHAAIDAVTAGWRTVDRVEAAISPGNRAPRGLSVIAAILSYAGAPVRVLRKGRWGDAPGWGLTVRRRMPGLGARLMSLCETPDLDLIPQRYPGVRTALFRAGLELPVLHLGLWAMSLLRRFSLSHDLARFAQPVRMLACAFERFGSDRGGMTVDVEGTDADGAPARAHWSLVADAGDGPNIPVLPTLAFISATIHGHPPAPPGAHAAAGLLALGDFDREAARFAIRSRIARSSPAAASLFERALGPDVARLPAVVRATHDPRPESALSGEVEVEGAATPLGRAIGAPFGFRVLQAGAPANVRIERTGLGETWTRRFAGSTIVSHMTAGERPGTLVERFGPLAFDLSITVEDEGFSLAVEGWRLLGLPMPDRLAPRTDAHGFASPDGRYGFDVAIALPMVGRLARYRGWLGDAREG